MKSVCVVYHTNCADFSLSGGCFGTDIIQKCTTWYQIGVHGLKIWQIFTTIQFAIRKKWKLQDGRQNKHKHVAPHEKKGEVTRAIPKYEKKSIIKLSLVHLIKFN